MKDQYFLETRIVRKVGQDQAISNELWIALMFIGGLVHEEGTTIQV